MEKMVRKKLAVMLVGAAIFAGSGLYAEMKCAPGKCGASMKSQMKENTMPCGCKKDKCKCDKKGKMEGKCGDGKNCAAGMKEKMKGKCGDGMKEKMKEKMKGEMKGKCAAGKCGGK